MFAVILQTLLLVSVTCLTILCLFITRRYGYWKKRGIPYKKPTFLVGNLTGLMRTSVWDFTYNLGKTYKTDYVGIYLGWAPALVINSKELAKKVLLNDFNYFQDRYTYSGDKDDPLGAFNLFTVKNPIWRIMKKEMTPMFTSLRLKGVTDLMNINSEELVQRIKKDHIDSNKPVHLRELFLMYVSDVVGNTAYGIRVSCLKELTSPIWVITRHMVTWTFWRGFEFISILYLPALAKMLRMKFFSNAGTDYLTKLFHKVVEDRKQCQDPNSKDLLNHLLNVKENLKLPDGSDPQLADTLVLAQMAVFIIGAMETSSNTLTYILHELAHNPREQEKLYQEVSTALNEKGNDVLNYNDLLELNYLTACIKETLRKYPPIALDRMCNDTYKLTDDVTLEKGTPVIVNVIAIHYNEEYYPEPHKWNPDRFEPSSDNDNRDFTFLPFGEGPRGCIGKRYGMMQLRSAIASLVTKFRFEPAEPYVLESDPYNALLGAKTGGKVKFVLR